MSVRISGWVSICAVAVVVAASTAACSGSGSPVPAGQTGSSAQPSSAIVSNLATTVPQQGGGSIRAFCFDYVNWDNSIAQGSPPVPNFKTVSPGQLALVNRLDSEAPAAVKSDMDAVATYIRQVAAGNSASADLAAGSQGFATTLYWVAQNCGSYMAPSPGVTG